MTGWILGALVAQAGTLYQPGYREFGTLLVEDNWPAAGDLDFNDVVLRYNAEVRQPSGGSTSEILLTVQPQALGAASICSGLALRLPVAPGVVTRAQRRLGTAGAADGFPWTAWEDVTVGSSVDVDGTHAVFTLSADLRADLLPATEGPVNTDPDVDAVQPRPMSVILTFSPAQALGTAAAPWDTYFFRCDDVDHELHLPGYYGTSNADPSLYGAAVDGSEAAPPTGDRWYVHGGSLAGLPFVLHVGEGTDPAYERVGGLAAYGRERVRVDDVFGDLATFAGGTGGLTWYQDNVDALLLFDDGNGVSPAAPAPAPLRGCADESREGFTSAEQFPDIAACGPIVNYPTSVANAAATCAPGWHMCARTDLNAHPPTSTSPAFTGGASYAWVSHTSSNNTQYGVYPNSLTCGGASPAFAAMSGTGGCTNSGAAPEGYRLATGAAWNDSHGSSQGCIAHTTHICGYPGGFAVVPAYTACCRD